MPGIVGLITKMPHARAKQELLNMLGAMRHGSTYGTGMWIDEPSGVYVGWTYRKNSHSGKLPLCNENGDVVLSFSGDEVSESEIAKVLKERGHQFELDGSSYLVHWYEDDPDSFPLGLNGKFHGLLADRKRGTAMLFNDRYGLGRIYYHESGEAFYFGAEAKAILAVCPELRRADHRSMGELVSCGCVLENRTLFNGIFVLPRASAWTFRNSSLLDKAAYFQPQDWERLSPLDPEAYYSELRETFSRILSRHFNEKDRIGVSLTGGLDSRMIMAWQKAPPGSLPCYSFGGMFRNCEDVKLAREVARICNQPYEVIPVGKEFLSNFSSYAERTVYLTDGCASVGRAPDLYANERAAGIASVRMTGNYGSEILRRLVAFKPARIKPRIFRPEFLSEIQTANDTYADLRRGNALSFIAFRQTPWHHYSLAALEETQLSMRSPYLDNDLVRTAYRAPGSAVANSDVFASGDECVRLIGDGNPALLRIRTDRGFGGKSGPLTATIARKWLEFTFKAEYAYDYGMPQSVAQIDHWFSALHFERLFLGRHKFIHFRFWYREALSAYVREMLLDSRSLSRPYLDARAVETAVSGHLKGNRNHTTEIHQLLTLELIHRLFLDSN